MKIAFLSTFYPFRGGIAQFNALLYRAMENENTVRAFTFKRQYPELLFPGETQFVTESDIADQIPAERVLDTVNPLTYIATASKIKKFAPDLLITKYWMSFFGPSLGFVLGKMNKSCKRIAILDNVIPHERRFFDLPVNRYFLKRNDGFVVMSDAVLADLLQLKPDARYLRINHPVYNHFPPKISQETAKKQLGLKQELKTILFFGFIRDYKGLDLLIQAMNLLDDSYQLVIAGEVYGSFEKYDKLISANKNKSAIHVFKKYIGDDEVAAFFSAADVCVLPYKSATQSGITSISWHYDLPLLATNVGGLKETIQDGVNGRIIAVPEVELIAESIRSYFDLNEKTEFSAAISRLRAENSWENFAAKLIDFAESL